MQASPTGREIPSIPAAPLSYREACALIEARGLGIKPDLNRIRALVELLDHPERTYPTVHVAGTNGKSSTARMIGAVLGAHGLTAGVYTSPHLQSIRERFLLAGGVPDGERAVPRMEEIPPDEFAGLVEYLLPFVELVEQSTTERVTYFELTTVMAFEWMAGHSAGAGVYEAGLGGSWDATNVIAGEVAVLTNVAVDHVAMLGPTPLDNAREKVGVIKPGTRVVSDTQVPEVADLIATTAADVGATVVRMGTDFRLRSDRLAHAGRLITVEGPSGGVYEDVFVPLRGAHQARNAALALAACEELVGRPLDGDAVSEGLGIVRSPGRLEVVASHPVVVLDGAHNPQAASALGAALVETFGDRRTVLVLSIFEDKDIEGMLRELLVHVQETICTQSSSPRAAPAPRLAQAAAALGFPAGAVESLPDAIQTARELAGPGGMVVVTGSLFAVGEARSLLVGPLE